MTRLVVVGVVVFCCVAGAETPPVREKSPPAQEKGPPSAQKPSASGPKLTLEILDRYIQYRRESDALNLEASEAMLRAATGPGPGINLMATVKQMKEADDAVRAKYGLSGPDFSELDRMIRDICDGKFMAESAAMKVMQQRFEAQAASPQSPERDVGKAGLALIRHQQAESAGLPNLREQYGDITVDLVLSREKDLKEIWARKDAAAAKAFKALDEMTSEP
jgi:hypothetical protein